MKKIFYSALILFILLPHTARSLDKMQIAVLDFKARGISKTTGQIISDLIRAEMVKTGFFVVVERDQMDSILKEQGFQKSGCTDSDCAVQLGKLLSAKKILLGEASKLGSSILITVRIVDVEKGVAEFAETEKAKREDTIDEACKALTKKLTKNILVGNKTGLSSYDDKKKQDFEGKYEIYESAKKSHITGCCITAIVPGGQHFYSENYGTGTLYLTGTVISYIVYINAFTKMADAEPGSEDESKYENQAGLAAILLTAVRLADVIHGYFAIEDYNQNLRKKLDSLSIEYQPEILFDIASSPERTGAQYKLGMTLRF